MPCRADQTRRSPPSLLHHERITSLRRSCDAGSNRSLRKRPETADLLLGILVQVRHGWKRLKTGAESYSTSEINSWIRNFLHPSNSREWFHVNDGAMILPRYRAAPYTGSVDNIPVHLCTHLIYSFAGLDETTWRVKSLEPYWDLDQGGFKQLVALKQKNPQLKVTFAIGGWNEGATKYSDLVSDPKRIGIFANSVLDWITTYGFDGVDLDWEYPADAARGGRSQDKANLITLLRALRKVIGDKLLTIATCIPENKIAAGYDVPELVKLVDFIHVMAYDLRGGWDSVIGNHVSLFPSSNDLGLYRKLTVVSHRNAIP